MSWVHSHAVSAHFRPFLDWLLHRHAEMGGLTELRVIARGRGVHSAIVGPQDLDPIAGWVAPHIGKANIYFGLNPVSPKAHARHPMRPAKKTVRDSEVLAYSMMAIDIDPERHPRGRSATDEEKRAALEVTERVRAFLLAQGVQSMLADSGNGYHLLIPLVPSDESDVRQAAKDARTLLHQLDRRFSTDAAHVDLTTFNPSRILKLYGTLAVKGENRPDYPHRWSTIDLTRIPEDRDLFAQLSALSSEEPPLFPASAPDRAPQSDGQLDWRSWRADALRALPLEQVFGPWLTGQKRESWHECRDPWASGGDRHPSAGVADGTGVAERGTFHSFRTGDSLSVFDFLIKRGEASDFRDATEQIGVLAGVQTPERRTVTQRFRRAWALVTTDRQRNGLIRKALNAALVLPAIEQHQTLEVIRQHSGLSLQVLRKSLREARVVEQTEPPEEDERPIVELSLHQDRVSESFAKIVGGIGPSERVFCHDKSLVFVYSGRGPQRITERNVVGLISSLIELRFLQVTDGEVRSTRFDVLPGDYARAFVHSPQVLKEVPLLVLYTRSPLFDLRWRYVGTPGFHLESGSWYDGPTVLARDGTTWLDQALADFHFKSPADRVNVLGAALTCVTMPHWGRGHPFVAINGNKPGVGKSTLARLLGVLAEGQEPSSISWVPDDSEFEKQIATRVEAGDRVIVIDNAKTRKPIQSAVLERCITDTRLNFRRLGSNTAISRSQNDLLFCLTMNLTQMGPDLRRRALPVKLELNEQVREVHYGHNDVVGWAIAHRVELVGELVGMVQRWLDAGKPLPANPARHSTGQAWAATIDGILRHSGIEGFLTNFEAMEHAFDPRYQLMQEIAQAHRRSEEATASVWVGRLDGFLADRFVDRHGRKRSDRSKATIVGALFREYLDARFDVEGESWRLVRTYPDGATRSPMYRFERAESG